MKIPYWLLLSLCVMTKPLFLTAQTTPTSFLPQPAPEGLPTNVHSLVSQRMASPIGQECGTVASPDPLFSQAHYESFERQFINQVAARSVLVRIPIRAHIMRTSSGTGGLTATQLNDAIATVNTFYSNSNMEFYLCGSINYVNNDTYYDFDAANQTAMTNAHFTPNVVNIYFCNTVISAGSNLCGYAYYPWANQDLVVMANSCTTNGSTLSHELGHYFGLYHTHQGGNEWVARTNCTTEGDLLCDTPADPTLSYDNVNASCVYTGIARDANNALYTPDIRNIMSYARKECRTLFSPQQYTRIAYYQQNSRSYLTCANASSVNLTKVTDSRSVSGNNVTFNITIQNTGTTVSSGFSVGFYASTSATDFTNARLLGRESFTTLSAGASVSRTRTMDLCGASLPTGSYYVGYLIDDQNQVTETNESDNFWTWSQSSVAISCGSGQPNLTQNSATLSVANQVATYNVSLINNGIGAASSFTTGFYASTSSTLSNPILLGRESFTGLSAGAIVSRTFVIDLCATGLTNATYYLGYIIDDQTQVPETNETDNGWVWNNNPQVRNCGRPNLTQSTASFTVTNQIVNFNVTLTNNGTGVSGGFTTGFYASTSSTLSNPILLGRESFTGLNAGATVNRIRAIDLCSAGLANGTYYLGYTIDDQAQVTETNEIDNSWVWSNNPQAVSCGCVGTQTLTACPSAFTDGSGNGVYQHDSQCSWLIQPATRSAITLNFSTFATELDYDWVAIYDGTSTSGAFLGRFSGSTLPPVLTATSGAMFVRFTTDASIAYDGWSATYTCNNLYTVSTSTNPATAGTTSGGGTFASGTSVTVRATANTGWQFSNWTENNVAVSTNANYTFPATANRTLIANFTAIVSNYTISTSANPATAGTTSGGGTFASGTSVTVRATANTGWQFSNWTENNVAVSTNANYTFPATANRTLIANFTANLPSDWIVTQTSENHTITLPATLTAQIDGGTIQNGDYLGVFYTNNGTQKCGGRQVWSGNSNAITAFGSDDPVLKNGFTNNEIFLWKLYRPSTNRVYNLSTTYLPTSGIYTHQGNYARDGISGVTSLRSRFVDSLRLRQNWNLAGLCIQPTNASIESILAPIASQVILVKTIDGRTYIPSTGINTIQTWNTQEGYKIKMSQAASTAIEGQFIDPTTFSIPFTTGWRFIPYTRMNPMLLSTVFAANNSQIDLAKDVDGATWVPSLGINNIGSASVNQSYQMKFNTSGNLYQPANRREDTPTGSPTLTTTYFVLDNRSTGNDATLILTQSVFSEVLKLGDELGIFNTAGLLCGSGVWRGENMAIAIHGDDAATPAQEGMRLGDSYQVYVKRLGVASQLPLSVDFEAIEQSNYKADNISWVRKAFFKESVPVVERLIAYPNPVQAILNLTLEGNSEILEVQLTNVMGHPIQLPFEYFVGTNQQKWQFSTNQLPNGWYHYQIKTAHQVHKGTFIVQND